MANASPFGIAQSDSSTLGMIPSFEYPSALIFSTPAVPTFSGSQQGVPPVNTIAGETAGAGAGADAALQYGRSVAQRSPIHQPILWLFILLAVGTFILAHSAHVSIRG